MASSSWVTTDPVLGAFFVLCIIMIPIVVLATALQLTATFIGSHRGGGGGSYHGSGSSSMHRSKLYWESGTVLGAALCFVGYISLSFVRE